jgi:molybdate transport system substrate-binding protein
MGLSMMRRRWLGLALAAATALAPAIANAQSDGMVVFAAASLKNALDEIATGWSKETSRPKPRISFASSSALAKQMEQGAPADLFISADLAWMDYVAKKDLIKADTRVNLLGNRIVLIAPKDSKTSVEVKQGFDLAKALAGGKLAMGNVDAVPAGKYGKAALGIVYSTDAAADPNVRIVGTFPADSHRPIIYPAAVTKNAKSADAKPFLDYLKSAKARPAFEKQGFTVLVK